MASLNSLARHILGGSSDRGELQIPCVGCHRKPVLLPGPLPPSSSTPITSLDAPGFGCLSAKPILLLLRNGNDLSLLQSHKIYI